MSVVIDAIPATTDRLAQIRQAQQEDPTLSQVMKYCQEGWPARHHIKGSVKQYWCVRSELCMHNELLLRADRIVIPTCLQQDILSRIHQGHQGIVKCRLRARMSVWWPGLSQQIKTMIEHCTDCCQKFQTHCEPLIPSPLPSRPLGEDSNRFI